MAKSKITLTFDNIVYGNNITLLLRLNGNVVNIMTEAFVTQRVGSSQVSLGTTTPTDNYLMTDEFKKAFDADYNTTNLFSLGQVGNTLEITCNYDYYTFELGSSENIGVSIENGTFTPDITIDNISFNVPSGDECSNTEVSVTTSEQVVNMTSPMSQSISNNPFVFEWQRGQTFSLEVDNGVKTAIKQVNTPSLLIAPSVNTLNNPSGATVSIFTQTSPASKDGLTFEYSLDGTTFKSSNVFTGILSGVYTAYVRDNFGCVKTTQFEVSELETNESLTPYHYYPQSNPIRTAIRESWDIYGKNDENTLSCEEEVPLVKPWNHLKQTNDFDTIQIRSNYNQVNVTIIDGVNQDVVSADKVSNYIGYKDKRDGKIFQRNNGKAGLYFEIGKTYDYDSGEDLNNDYFLNGSLPEWGKSGNYIFLDGIGFFQITGKIFDNDKNAWVLEFDHITNDADIIVSCVYNKENYEVYEFDLDYSLYENKDIRFLIEHINSNETVSYLSEIINVKQKQEKTILWNYWGSENTDIDYTLTGLRHSVRLRYERFYNSIDNGQEINKADDKVEKTDSYNYKTKVLELSYLPTGVFNQLSEIFSLDNLFGNGIRYNSESLDPSEPLGQTNWYELKINLLNAGKSVEDMSFLSTLSKVLGNVKLKTFEGNFINVADNGQSPILLSHGSGVVVE